MEIFVCVCEGKRSCVQTLWGGDMSSPWRTTSHGVEVSGIWYLVDPPEAPTQPEGFPENVGHPTATWRLTRSRQGGSKRAAHARTLRHQGLTPAVVLGVWGGGGAPLDWGSGWVPRALSGSRLGGASQGKGPRRGADWGCAGAQTGAAHGRRLGLRRGADWGRAGAQTGAAHARRLGLRRGADWGCAGAQTGAAHGRRLGPRRSADWGCAWARLGLCRGADWGCAGAQTGAAHGRRLGLRMGADWGCAGAQTGAAHARRLGLRRGADWGCAGAQTWEAQEGGGGRLTTGFWRPPQAPGSSPGGYWGPGQRVREGLTTGFWPRAVGGGRAGGPFRLVPPGAGSVVHGHRPAEAVSYGAHVGSWPRAHGGGSQLSPPEVLAGCPWGGGGHAVSCVLGGELPPMAKPRRPLRAGEPPLGWRVWQGGGEGESGAVLGELIGSFLEKVARVTLNPFYCMAFALDGFPGQLDIMSIA